MRATVAAAVCVLVLAGAPIHAASPAAASQEACDRTIWSDYDRPAEHAITVDRDVTIEMADGTRLVADVHRPDADGTFPVLLTQTAYNKNLPVWASEFLVERGYVHVVVDVRGTGGSEGTWDSFGLDEQRDGLELAAWAVHQPWSDGSLGLWGPSYMAITQIYTAAQRPEGLKAIFLTVPMADAYRDIVFVGGQTNLGFIPFWMGLVTAAGLVPPTYAATDPVRAAAVLAGHALGAATEFQVPVVAEAALGGDRAYDGEFYRVRSPIEVVDRVEVPAFVVAGHHDLFQRGAPLLYEALKDRVEAKLLTGPWTHVDAASGAGLPAEGVPDLDRIALRWFDGYVKGLDTSPECMPDVTQYRLGAGGWEVHPDWPHPGIAPQRWHLGAGGTLGTTPPEDGEATSVVPQLPVSGICSRGLEQWTAGLVAGTGCAEDNRLTELTELTFTSDLLDRDLVLSGPLAARLWVSTTARDAVVVTRVTHVDPSGVSTELTAGMLTASRRAVDEGRSRWIDGEMMQPYHRFTREAVEPVVPGEVMPLDIEIFPTNATIPAGHRLRVTVGPAQFPTQVPPLPVVVDQLGGLLTIHHDEARPSWVALPALAEAATVAPPVTEPLDPPAPEPPAPDPSLPATGGGATTAVVALLAAALLAVRRARPGAVPS